MKKILIVTSGLIFLCSNLLAIVNETDKNIFNARATHAVKCTQDGVLGTVNCMAQCARSGWSGQAFIANPPASSPSKRGVYCWCNNGTKAFAKFSNIRRCSASVKNSLGGNALSVYLGSEGDFVNVPLNKTYVEKTTSTPFESKGERNYKKSDGEDKIVIADDEKSE